MVSSWRQYNWSMEDQPSEAREIGRGVQHRSSIRIRTRPIAAETALGGGTAMRELDDYLCSYRYRVTFSYSESFFGRTSDTDGN